LNKPDHPVGVIEGMIAQGEGHIFEDKNEEQK
jgi:hypothetical protein